jgi:elongation factor P
VISTNQFKNGAHIEVDGTVYRIMDFQHVKPGKGGAFVRTKLRKAEDGSVVDKTFRAGEKFRPVRTETRRMQFLYDSGEHAVFMDVDTYEQSELARDAAGDEMKWVRPNDTVEILYVDERPSGVQVPSAVCAATPPPAAARSRRRSRPAWRFRSRCSSTRASSSASTPVRASTSPEPDGSP